MRKPREIFAAMSFYAFQNQALAGGIQLSLRQFALAMVIRV